MPSLVWRIIWVAYRIGQVIRVALSHMWIYHLRRIPSIITEEMTTKYGYSTFNKPPTVREACHWCARRLRQPAPAVGQAHGPCIHLVTTTRGSNGDMIRTTCKECGVLISRVPRVY